MKYVEKVVRMGQRVYTVVIPCDSDGIVNSEWIMDADRKSLNAMLGSMAMLLQNRNLIIYFPVWKNKIAKDLYRVDDLANRQQNFDVIFMSHTLQLPIHRWKELRGKLKKIKGSYRTKEFNLHKLNNKVEKICEKHENKNIYYRKLDLNNRYFRFDTHFFVGGPYSFAKSCRDVQDLLSEPLEHKFCTHHFQDWICFPQECSFKNDW